MKVTVHHPTGEIKITGLEPSEASAVSGAIHVIGEAFSDDKTERVKFLEGEIIKAQRMVGNLNAKLEQYERQGGTLNMERSWKTKYRNALMEANQSLIDAGLDPVRIRKGDMMEPVGISEQLSLAIARMVNIDEN